MTMLSLVWSAAAAEEEAEEASSEASGMEAGSWWKELVEEEVVVEERVAELVAVERVEGGVEVVDGDVEVDGVVTGGLPKVS